MVTLKFGKWLVSGNGCGVEDPRSEKLQLNYPPVEALEKIGATSRVILTTKK